MRNYKFDREFGPRAKLVICFDYIPGTRGCHTQSNGDPGWPDDPEELVITDVQVWNRDSDNGTWNNCHVSLDEDILPTEKVEQWATDFIEQQRESEQAERAEYERDYE